MKKILLITLALTSMLFAEEVNKTGLNFGVLPAIAFDTDLGFRYGGLTNIYHYGDGSNYPKYDHSLYLEWSQTTKGSSTMTMNYDSEYLIPDIRVTAEVSYYTEKGLDFFGFNGYESHFNANFVDDEADEYKTRIYYKHDRALFRMKADFQGAISGKLRWLGGYTLYNTSVAPVDVDALNDGKDPADTLDSNAPTLYEEYLDAGIISEDQSEGGMNNMLKMGIVYDTRDNEPNPMSGIWTEALVLTAPGFLGNDFAFTKFILTHRQYFTLIPNDLSFVYRVGIHQKIAGDIPFYMLPHVFDSKQTKDGLGGAKNLRGMMRNRVVGDGMAYTNLELRWKFYRGVLGGQNVYLALNTFTDAGMVYDRYEYGDYDASKLSGQAPTEGEETVHVSYGAGLRIAMNQNFIVAIDYGMAASEQDGASGLYIGLNYLF